MKAALGNEWTSPIRHAETVRSLAGRALAEVSRKGRNSDAAHQSATSRHTSRSCPTNVAQTTQFTHAHARRNAGSPVFEF